MSFRSIVNSLRRAGFLRDVSVLVGGTAIGQAVTIISIPVISRLYDVTDFGNAQMYSSILMFVLALVALRYEQAILLPRNERDAASLVIVGLIAVTMVSLVFSLMIVVILGLGWTPDRMGQLRPYLWIMPLSLFGAGVYTVIFQWTLRLREYRELAVTKVTQSTGQCIVQVSIAGFFGTGLAGLVLGDLIGRSAGTVRLLRRAWRSQGEVFRTIRWKEVSGAAIAYRRFPLISSGSGLINIAGIAVPALMIGGGWGPQVLGWFALVERAMSMPMTLLGASVSQVYSVEASGLLMDPVSHKALFFKIMRNLALLGSIPFLVLLLFSKWIFSMVLGPSWTEAGVYSQILCPMNYLVFISWPLSSTLNLLQRQDWQLFWDLGRMVLSVGALSLAAWMDASPRTSIATYGFVMIVSYSAHLTLSYAAIVSRRSQHPAIEEGGC